VVARGEFTFDRDARPVRMRGVVVEVTDRKLAEAEVHRLNEELRQHAAVLEQRVAERTAELADARDKAQAADRAKSAFLATMSHELRTPLNSVIGFTGLLLKEMAGPLNDEQAKQLRMVNASGLHLLALISDVLDMSKIEAGELTTSAAPFDLGDAVRTVAAAVTPLAEKKRLALVVDVRSGAASVTSDRRRVEQVLLNLLSNAIKFTDHGSVTLTVEPVPGAIRLAVMDTGVGIRQENLGRLFRPFQQLDSGLSRQHEGTGLGLAISQRLVERLGGTISVESRPGQGSTFSFTLPAGRTEAR
jgi:signal transduction histidine kinase